MAPVDAETWACYLDPCVDFCEFEQLERVNFGEEDHDEFSVVLKHQGFELFKNGGASLSAKST